MALMLNKFGQPCDGAVLIAAVAPNLLLSLAEATWGSSLCFPSTQGYNSARMSTAVSYVAKEATGGLLGVRELLFKQ